MSGLCHRLQILMCAILDERALSPASDSDSIASAVVSLRQNARRAMQGDLIPGGSTAPAEGSIPSLHHGPIKQAIGVCGSTEEMYRPG